MVIDHAGIVGVIMSKPTTSKANAEIELGSVTAVLDMLRKPASLERAEASLTAMRAYRTDVASLLQKRCAEVRAAGKTSDQEITRLTLELSEADAAVNAGRELLRREQQAFEPRFRAAIRPKMVEAGHSLDDLAQRLTSTLDALTMIRRAGERIDCNIAKVPEGIEPRLIAELARRLIGDSK